MNKRRHFSDVFGELFGMRPSLKNTVVFGESASDREGMFLRTAKDAIGKGGVFCMMPRENSAFIERLFHEARARGRDDDFVSLRFAGAKNGGKALCESNAFNPFAAAGSDEIREITEALLPKDDGGANSVFRQKACALLSALIPVLLAIRDAGEPLPLTDMSKVEGIWRKRGSLGGIFSIALLRDYLEPAMCASLAYPLKFDGSREECGEVAKYADEAAIDRLKRTLRALNYEPDAETALFRQAKSDGKSLKDIDWNITPEKRRELLNPRAQQAHLDQFGYAKGYFGAPLAMLSGMYGHLFNRSACEADLHDILLNRRICAVTAPPFERFPQEAENIGAIMLASLRRACGDLLGNPFDGRRFPQLLALDSCAGLFFPEEMGAVLEQGQACGIELLLGMRVWLHSKARAKAIIENTATKIFFQTDNQDTLALAASLALDAMALRNLGPREFLFASSGESGRGELDGSDPETRGTAFLPVQWLPVEMTEKEILENISSWLNETD